MLIIDQWKLMESPTGSQVGSLLANMQNKDFAGKQETVDWKLYRLFCTGLCSFCTNYLCRPLFNFWFPLSSNHMSSILIKVNFFDSNKIRIHRICKTLVSMYRVRGHCTEVVNVQRWSLYRCGHCTDVVIVQRCLLHEGGHCTKVVIVRRWSLYKGGHCTEVVIVQRWSLLLLLLLL